MAPYIERFVKLAEKIRENPILMPTESDRTWIISKLKAEAEEFRLAIEALDEETTQVLKDGLEKILAAIQTYDVKE